MTTSEAQKVASAVLECTIRDALGRRFADRPRAIAWLASRQASPYYDILDINQAAFLERIGWAEWAQEALDPTLPKDVHKTISHSLEALVNSGGPDVT